jgi:hypothetical protein
MMFFISFLSFILFSTHYGSIIAEDFVMELIAGTGVEANTGNGGPGPLASVDYPAGIWSDSVGNAYFVTYFDSHVRVVDGVTGIISSLMGDGTHNNFNIDSGPGPSISLFGCQGITGDTLGEYLYVIDALHVYKYEIATGIATRYAGAATHLTDSGSPTDGGQATDALFQVLAGGWLTDYGTLFIVDEFGSQVYKITTDGIISRVSGKNARGYAGDDGPANSADVMFKFPNNIYVDSVGEMYISDAGNQVIRKIDNTGILTTFAGGGGSYPVPGIDIGTRDLAVGLPYAISGDTNGNIFYADYGSDAVFKIDSNQRVTTYIGRAGWGGINVASISPSSANIRQPYGVYWNNFKNRIYITEQTGLLIKRSIPGGSLYPTSGPSSSPTINPSSSPTSGPVSVPTIVPTSAPSVPTSIPSSKPISSPSGEPTSAPALPTSIPSSRPIASPSGAPTSAPAVPTSLPSSVPVAEPSSAPTSSPAVPTSVPSWSPSSTPSTIPSASPKASPTSAPTLSPEAFPTSTPTCFPSSSSPSEGPSSRPSSSPVSGSTAGPSRVPSSAPSTRPSREPSSSPSCSPTTLPSTSPSSEPTDSPSGQPSTRPSSKPTAPSFAPTLAPNANDQVKIQGNVVIMGVHSNSLNNASVATIQKAVTNVSSNAQQTAVTSISLIKKKGHFQVSAAADELYTYRIGFQCLYNMAFYPTFNSSYFAEIRTKEMKDSVKSGYFEYILKHVAVNKNATQLLDASCDVITLSTSVGTSDSSSSTSSDHDEDKLNDGKIVGVVIGCFVGGFFIFFILSRFYNVDGSRKQHQKDDPAVIL